MENLYKGVNESTGEEFIGYFIGENYLYECDNSYGDRFILCEKDSIKKMVSKKDKNDKDIFVDDKFTFTYHKDNETLEFVGSFSYDESDLRWEIDIYDNPYYTALWYDCQFMGNFELVEEN